MKPIHLTISGWGPYKEREEIDFEALSARGIFLITGPTGAGKTTIFDAVTYALYGNVSGEMREKNSVRSHFAQGDTKTYVELIMEHNKKRYQIRRNPEYQRPSKRKNGADTLVTEKENALLTLPDGSKTEGVREVNKRVQELLLLDYRQFKQISMIAQGEFSRFLTAASAEKTKIFREIFSTSIYDAFAAGLKKAALEAEKRVVEYHHRMDENIRTYHTEDSRFAELTREAPYPYRELAALLETLQKERTELAGEKEKAWKESEAAFSQNAVLLEKARYTNSQFDRLMRMQNKSRELLAQADRIEKLDSLLQRARQAEPIQQAWLRWQEAEQACKKDLEQIARAETAIEQLAGQRQQLLVFRQEQAFLRQLPEAVTALEQLSGQERVLKQEAEQKDRLRKQAQEAYLEAERSSMDKKQAYERANQQVRYAMVGIVAGMLKPGSPCPVCGSTRHPAPAPTARDVPDEAALKQLQKQAQEAEKQSLACYSKAQQAHQQAGQTAEQLEQTRLQQQQLQEKAQEVRQRILELSGEDNSFFDLVRSQKPVSGAALQQALEQALLQLEQREAAQRTWEENLALLTARQKQSQREAAEKKEAAELLLQKQGFWEEQEWRAALLPEAKQQQLEQEILTYREETAGCKKVITELEEALLGSTRADEAALQKRQEALSAVCTGQEAAYRQALLDAKEAQRTAEALQKNLARLGGAEEEYGRIKDLDNMASGNNSKRLVFEQYVLAGYFEKILGAANLRLQGLSGGRYELFRAAQVSDGRKKDNLEMEVMDYYTGRRRSVSTLSGGEAFKASLSLALGMSDVIQAENGGIRVDTLFIDEGFGALDGQSLEQACDILTGLAGQDRLIGIISHVQQLRERIDTQIVIERRRDGSSIRLRT